MSKDGAKRAVSALRRLVSRLKPRGGEQKRLAEEIQLQLSLLEQELGVSRRPQAATRTGEKTSYSVENVQGQPMLTEFRPRGNPLRVPRRDYDAVVTALAAGDRPLSFEEIVVSAATHSPVADWQVRVVLRHLLRSDPPILRRARSRYGPLSPATFRGAAVAWWDTTAS